VDMQDSVFNTGTADETIILTTPTTHN